MKYIEQVVWERSDWIFSNKEKQIAKLEQVYTIEVKDGEKLLLFGKYYAIKVDQIEQFSFSGENFIFPKNKHDQAEDVIINWYKRTAKKIIKDRLEHFAELVDCRFNNFKISSAKKRWGSCSSKGNLNFSWRLMLAPIKIIDYVIAHELSHLKHLDHSREFWAYLESFFPEYKRCEKWLKDNGHLLDIRIRKKIERG